MMGALIGIDFGTSVAKGTAIDRDGKVLSQVASSYTGSAQKGHIPIVWACFGRLIRALLRAIGKTPIQCIAISGMVPNVILVDCETGKVVGEELMFYDRRAYQIERKLDRKLKTSRWANEVLSKLIWLRMNHHDAKSRTLKVFSTHSYIVWRLTGAYCIDPVTAAEYGVLFDSTKGEWNSEIVGTFNLDNISWPPIRPASEIAGRICEPQIGRLVGGTAAVVVGTSDSISTCIGAGLKFANDTLVYYGTFNSATNLLIDLEQCLSSVMCPMPFDWWCSVPRSGEQLKAMASILFPGSGSLERFDRAAEASKPGANGIIFLHNTDIRRTTVSTIPEGHIIGLAIGHSAGDIARSVMESFAYLLRWSAANAGINLRGKVAHCAGGGARSSIWRQIVSDVTGLVQIHIEEGDRGLGSALLSLRAVSKRSFYNVLKRKTKEAVVVQPNRANDARYDNAYSKYISTWR